MEKLDYLNATYYDGNRGQFLSEDPVFNGNPKVQSLHDPQNLNAYSYSENNPVIKEDPKGRTSALIPGQGLVYDYNGTNESVCCSVFSPLQYLQNPIAAQLSSKSGSGASPSNLVIPWQSYTYNQNRQNGIIMLGGGNTPAGVAASTGIVVGTAGVAVLGADALASAALDCAIDCDVANYLAQIASKGGARTITTIGRAGSLIEGIGEDTTPEEAAQIKQAYEDLEGNPWANINILKPAAAISAIGAAINIINWFLKPYNGDTDVQEGP